MLRSKLCSSGQGGALFSCCVSNEDPSEHKIDRRAIGPPTDFRHLAHMGSSGCSTSVLFLCTYREYYVITSSTVSGAGLDDTSTQPPITTHLKLIELSEALAAHNASAAAALRLTNQESVTSIALHPPPFSVTSRVSEAAVPADRKRRKSTTTSRYLISGPLPPPPPPPPSALIT
ncbi:CRIB [Echinococcus multilocularis]|uniref:CRIB n=1 Tax=Echinococcus multilocularis TaxID=6211 RepID=A0A0S4MIW0_ECHMU|nr:CRIB [Echinococcus multilocularis]